MKSRFIYLNATMKTKNNIFVSNIREYSSVETLSVQFRKVLRPENNK